MWPLRLVHGLHRFAPYMRRKWQRIPSAISAKRRTANSAGCCTPKSDKKKKKLKEIKSILLLSNAFNSMSQRFWCHLIDKGYNVHFETVNNEDDIRTIYNEKVMNTADPTATSNFDLILCPFLTKRIPSELYTNGNGKKPKVLIVHPGIKGDRGISSIDWRLIDGYNSVGGNDNAWGVSIIEAHDEMDFGDIYSSHNFEMVRPNTKYKFSKSNLYQKEVITAALIGLDDALYKLKHNIAPERLNYDNEDVKGTLRPTIKAADRKFEWSWNASNICKNINASTSTNGVLTELNGSEYFVYDAAIEWRFSCHLSELEKIDPGTILGVKNDSILVSSGTKPIWITTAKKKGKNQIRLPAAMVIDGIENIPIYDSFSSSYNDIYYEIKENIVYLHFDFFNGAFDTNKCIRLQLVLNEIAQFKQEEIVVLMGGYQYFGNGINLNTIEGANNCELESFRNIEAMNNIIQTVLSSFENKLIVSAVHGNTGAGSCMLAFCADVVWTHHGVVFNPHYKLMGLYGSEYWTETFARRIGCENAKKLTNLALPLSAKFAASLGLVDEIIAKDTEDFREKLIEKLVVMNRTKSFKKLLEEKHKMNRNLNWIKKAENHRRNEMGKMLLNFQSNEYKQSRYDFINKIYQKRVVTNQDAQSLLSVVSNNINHDDVSSANVLNCKDLANATLNMVRDNINDYKNTYHRVPKLAILCVGFDDNLDLYTRNKIRTAQKIGMMAELVRIDECSTFDEVECKVEELNADASTDGIIIQLPLPQHLDVDTNRIMNLISPFKDVDGLTMHSNNKLREDTNDNCQQLMKQLDVQNYYKHHLDDRYMNVPCVPFGIMQCLNTFESLKEFNESLKGKHAVIIGNSEIIGKPITEILLSKKMTVTCTHEYTEYLSDITCQADLVITATGVPRLFKKEWVKNGSVIFDVGIAYNAETDTLCGDVDMDGLMDIVHAVTPVPGGVGPLTVSSVLSNTVNSAKWKQVV